MLKGATAFSGSPLAVCNSPLEALQNAVIVRH